MAHSEAFVVTSRSRRGCSCFGGCGISGIGREGGDYALDFHSDIKTLMILDDSTE